MNNLTTTFLLLLLVSLLVSADRSFLYMDDAYTHRSMNVPSNPVVEREFREDFLNLMGLRETPRPHRPVVPRHMLALYATLNEEAGVPMDMVLRQPVEAEPEGPRQPMFDYHSADTIISFPDKNSLQYGDELMFDFSSENRPSASLLGAELWLYRNASRASDKAKLLRVCVTDGDASMTLIEEQCLAHKLMDVETGWSVLNASDTVAKWLNRPASSHAVKLLIQDLHTGDHLSPQQAGIVHSNLIGFFTDEMEPRYVVSSSKRRKRSLAPDGGGGGSEETWARQFLHHGFIYAHSGCRKRALYVNFEELGWSEWVIAPMGYAAYYCQGECKFPLDALSNASNHAIVQALAQQMHGSLAPPSCAASELGPLQMLYFDNKSNIVLKRFRDMVVRTCGCH